MKIVRIPADVRLHEFERPFSTVDEFAEWLMADDHEHSEDSNILRARSGALTASLGHTVPGSTVWRVTQIDEFDHLREAQPIKNDVQLAHAVLRSAAKMIKARR